MYKNPVYKRELTTENRSLRFPAVLMLFCSLLVFLGIFCLYFFTSKAEQTGYIDYSVMLKLYVLIVTTEFILIMLYIPFPAGMSISGEREKKQFDLLCLTAVSPVQIILGKLGAILTTSLLLCIMGTPVLSLVFIYGGIQMTDILLLLGTFIIEIIYTASAGILISSLFRSGTLAVFVNYCILGFSNALGLFFLFSPYFGISSYAGSGSLYTYYPLLLTPTAAFYELISNQAGDSYAVFDAINSQGLYTHTIITENWLSISLVLHIGISLLAISLAADRIRLDKPKATAG